MEPTVLNPDDLNKYLKPITPIPTDLAPSGHLDQRIACILFDIYGTLFISGSGDIGTQETTASRKSDMMNLLSRFNIQKSVSNLMDEYFSAVGKAHADQKQRGMDFPEVEIDHLWMEILKYDNRDTARVFAVEFELIMNPVFPMPHLIETLEACLENNIILGIISNAQFYTPYLFKWFFGKEVGEIGFHKDLLFYSYKTAHAKPSLHMFEQAADQLRGMGIEEAKVLYVGNDMLNDILPGNAVGFNTALFAGDTRSLRIRKEKPECRELKPELIITDLIQLIDYIL